MLLRDSGRTGSEVTHPVVSCAVFSNDWMRRLLVFSLGRLASVKDKRL